MLQGNHPLGSARTALAELRTRAGPAVDEIPDVGGTSTRTATIAPRPTRARLAGDTDSGTLAR